MTKRLIIILLLIFSTEVAAQDKMIYPRYRIGVIPTSFFSDYPSVQISLDRRLNENINISMDGGYVFDFTSRAEGYLLRPGLELMLARGRWISYAFGVNMTYKNTIGEQTRKIILGRATNGEFRYVNFLDVETLVVGANLSSTALIKLSKRIFIEALVAVGGGRRTVFVPGTEIPSFGNTGNTPLTAPLSIHYAQLNFSYAIGL